MQQQFAGPEQVCTSGQNKARLEGTCTRANRKIDVLLHFATLNAEW